jgi:hypothetical protein
VPVVAAIKQLSADSVPNELSDAIPFDASAARMASITKSKNISAKIPIASCAALPGFFLLRSFADIKMPP